MISSSCLFLKSLIALAQSRISCRTEDLDCQDRSVFGPVYGYGGYRYAFRHLYDRKQGIQTIHGAGFHRQTNDRQRRGRRQHTRQMSRLSCRCDDDIRNPFASAFAANSSACFRSSVGRDDPRFILHAETLSASFLLSLLQDNPICFP